MKWYVIRKALLAGFVVSVSLVAGVVCMTIKDLEPITADKLESRTYRATSVIYDDGTALDNPSGGDKKLPVEYKELPDNLKKAIIAIEDERYYEHPGVDIKGLARSVVKTLMGTPQGGSTLTMQTSKMLLTSSDVSIPRKIKDIIYAYQMDAKLGKEKVLELYLNNFPVGRGFEGAAAGAKGYFSKTLDQLTISECALLAGSTQNPVKYSAYNTAKLTGEETKEQLDGILLFYINDQEAFDKATDDELEFVDQLSDWGLLPNSSTYQQLKNGTMVVRKAVPNPKAKERRNLVLDKMYELKFITQKEWKNAKAEPIVIDLPKKVEEASSTLKDFVEDETIDALMASGYSYDEATKLYNSGGLKVNTTVDKSAQDSLEDIYAKGSNFPGNITDANGVLQPQSASVVLDNHNGEIKAMIGGRNITGRQVLNRAISPIQPGSSIKPLSVYAPVIESGQLTESSVFSDSEGGYRFDKNNAWDPKTTTGGHRDFDLKTAVAKSSNTIAVKVGELLGATYDECVDAMIAQLKDFGLTDVLDTSKGQNDREFSSLVLGGMSKGAKPLEMAAAYATFANSGKYVEPTIIKSIEDYEGNMLYEYNPKPRQVISDGAAYIMTDMLQAVTTEGTGKPAKLSKFPVAGKTGTTNDKLEVWFVGYTPYYTCATYIADDAGRVDEKGNRIDRRGVKGGSHSSAKVWKLVMDEVHKGLPGKQFEKPNTVKRIGGKYYLNSSDPHRDSYTSMNGGMHKSTEIEDIEKENDNEINP